MKFANGCPRWRLGSASPPRTRASIWKVAERVREQLKAMRATMALLDEWQAPEPSPYFDMRLQARLREEMAKPQAGWLQWFRRPVLAAALTVLMGVGVGLFVTRGTDFHIRDADRWLKGRDCGKRPADSGKESRHVFGFRIAGRSGSAAGCRSESVSNEFGNARALLERRRRGEWRS